MIARIVKFSFSFHLIPAEVISDNGPQYSSREFQEFAKEYGLNIPPTHHTSQEHMEKHKEPSKLLRICGERTMIST
jgi:transposase InsO family protein